MTKKKCLEFSKRLMIMETVIVCVLTISTLVFCLLSILYNYSGSLAYLTTLTTAAWGAYGWSVQQYMGKAKAENVIKIEKNIDNVDC
jgi:hypothetical protein